MTRNHHQTSTNSTHLLKTISMNPLLAVMRRKHHLNAQSVTEYFPERLD